MTSMRMRTRTRTERVRGTSRLIHDDFGMKPTPPPTTTTDTLKVPQGPTLIDPVRTGTPGIRNSRNLCGNYARWCTSLKGSRDPSERVNRGTRWVPPFDLPPASPSLSLPLSNAHLMDQDRADVPRGPFTETGRTDETYGLVVGFIHPLIEPDGTYPKARAR